MTDGYDLIIGQGDSSPPPLQKQLLDAAGNAPNLTGKTVTCTVQAQNGCGGVHSVTTLAAGDVIDAVGGFVQHQWVAVENAQPGLLLVSFNDGSVTYPVGRYFRVRVTRKL